MDNIVSDKIFDFVYGRALRDATIQKAYDADKGEKIKLYNARPAKCMIKKYVKELLRGNNPDFYETARKVEEEFHSKKFEKFTFGNTQKLINMTVKYIYIAAYCSDNFEAFRDKFRKCHCPMDGKIVKRVIEELNEKIADKEVQNLIEKHKNNWRTFLQQSWSKISSDDKEPYEFFQKIVKYICDKEQLIPIEYDYKEWE